MMDCEVCGGARQKPLEQLKFVPRRPRRINDPLGDWVCKACREESDRTRDT